MRARTSVALAVTAVVVVAGIGYLAWAERQPVLRPTAHAVVVQDAAPEAAPVDSPPATSSVDGTHIERLAARTRVSPRWLAKTAGEIHIPSVALEAFARAALVVHQTQPGCQLGWNTLAAIGYEESADGTLGGSSVGTNGDVSPPILGPVLDGNRFEAVRDTDHGKLDGDSTWDRAVGPMQFLPGTWRTRGLDGNGDGVASPNNLDDAALTAGVYLCAAGGSLATGDGWDAAVRSFNHSDSYVNAVRAVATGYARETR